MEFARILPTFEDRVATHMFGTPLTHQRELDPAEARVTCLEGNPVDPVVVQSRISLQYHSSVYAQSLVSPDTINSQKPYNNIFPTFLALSRDTSILGPSGQNPLSADALSNRQQTHAVVAEQHRMKIFRQRPAGKLKLDCLM